MNYYSPGVTRKISNFPPSDIIFSMLSQTKGGVRLIKGILKTSLEKLRVAGVGISVLCVAYMLLRMLRI